MTEGVPGRPDRQPRATLDTVAKRAAVSRQTVSNVLNAPHLLRPETLERVRGAITELGYRPHQAAQQLRTRRSRTLGLRLEPHTDGINGAVLDRFLHAFTEKAQDAGYRLMLFTAADDQSEITRYGELLDTASVDAFVLTSTHHADPRTSWLADHKVPFVTFGRPWTKDSVAPARHPWVDVDGAAGTRAATEHALAQGHRQIGFLGWPAGSGSGDDRRAGWRSALAAAGVAPSELAELDTAVPDGVTHGFDAAAALLASGPAPTSWVCASDSLAIGAMSAAVSAGRRDITVTGFDDTPVAAALGLSSVAQPLVEAAAHCLDLLVHPVGPQAGDSDLHRLLQPTLVVRGEPTRPI
jgi:DNA-binding LacI/PurR family transcriptional regulator